MRIGLVSDTHGLVDPRLGDVLHGVELVLHAGDIVKPRILEVLREIAPVKAVRGNNDEGLPALGRLPETALVEVGALTLLLVHDLGARERPKPPARPLLVRHRPELVVHGHSHRPGVARVGDTLFVNPGSAGPRRFSLPRTAALLEVHGRRVSVTFFDLAGDPPALLGEPVEAAL
ncbi:MULTISPECIES: metallophosphoesterase family protein [Anaeromyxobacter]|uniref:metallophosphoesterase family protein n=1 Tax=Anaeromyxobacter TaxID=161492 RepID=UPI001F58180D|nr:MULTISPECIES: metallophosphoesterase family protein [unclassified Anaeromyxobacter]